MYLWIFPIIYVVLSCSDGDSGKSHKVPCILHMDSIKGSHTGLKNLIQRYTIEVHFILFFLRQYAFIFISYFLEKQVL